MEKEIRKIPENIKQWRNMTSKNKEEKNSWALYTHFQWYNINFNKQMHIVLINSGITINSFIQKKNNYLCTLQSSCFIFFQVYFSSWIQKKNKKHNCTHVFNIRISEKQNRNDKSIVEMFLMKIGIKWVELYTIHEK